MQLKLPILPLHTIDTISYQKCLLPIDKFPVNAIPGQWAKCYLTGKDDIVSQSYIVAQVFPRRELQDVCYMDKCVISLCDFHNNEDITLDKLELLEETKECKAVKVSYQINPEYFVEYSTKFNKSYLLEMTQILLQKYYLSEKCRVKDHDFQMNGIDSIQIEIEEICDNSVYILTDNTNINIKKISLTYNVDNKDLESLMVKPFMQAAQELEDLIEIVRLQRLQKRSLCMSLSALLVGAVGSGKTCIVEDFLRRHNCNVFRIGISNCLKQYPGETEAELRKVFKAATDFESKFKAKDPTVILLEELQLLCPQANSNSRGNNSESIANSLRISAQLLGLVDSLQSSKTYIICLATTSKPDSLNELARRPGRFENEILINALQEDDRYQILKQFLQKSIPNLQISHDLIETMAKQTQGYVIADLALLIRNLSQTLLTKPQENVKDLINEMLIKSKPTFLKESDVIAYRTTETFDSIGGMLELKKTLQVSVLAGLKQRESFARFGLSLPKGVLLYGPPGCAKTTIAKCLATEANMTFISTSGAEVYSPYVGCAEKFIAKIFQTARKNSPCLIFLDEIDSLVGRRSLGSSSNSSDVQVRILSTLLTEMDGIITTSQQTSHILVVAASNRPDMVDDALMRPGRFDKLIHVPAPDLKSRLSILELYKRKMPFAESIDLEAIAMRTNNYSGADICNLCNEAAMQAFQRDFNCRQIEMKDFEMVLKTTKSSLLQNQIDWYYQFENKF